MEYEPCVRSPYYPYLLQLQQWQCPVPSTRGVTKTMPPIFFLRNYNYNYVYIYRRHILQKIQIYFPQSLLPTFA